MSNYALMSNNNNIDGLSLSTAERNHWPLLSWLSQLNEVTSKPIGGVKVCWHGRCSCNWFLIRCSSILPSHWYWLQVTSTMEWFDQSWNSVEKRTLRMTGWHCLQTNRASTSRQSFNNYLGMKSRCDVFFAIVLIIVLVDYSTLHVHNSQFTLIRK